MPVLMIAEQPNLDEGTYASMLEQLMPTGRNSLPGDLAVWDGHVAMVVGNGMIDSLESIGVQHEDAVSARSINPSGACVSRAVFSATGPIRRPRDGCCRPTSAWDRQVRSCRQGHADRSGESTGVQKRPASCSLRQPSRDG